MSNQFRPLKLASAFLTLAVCLVLMGCGKDDKKEKSGGGGAGGGNAKVNKENFAKIKPTMTEKEVLEIIGEPSKTKDIPGGKELTWEGGAGSITIGFKAGKIEGMQSAFVNIK